MTILIVFDGHDTAEDYLTLLEDHEHLMLKPCISMIMHQHTKQDL